MTFHVDNSSQEGEKNLSAYFLNHFETISQKNFINITTMLFLI